MNHIQTFNENIDDNEPYIIMCFNINLKRDDINPEGILKSPPIKGIKKLKRWVQIINHLNMILKMTAGKNVYIEKYNFETMEDLDKWENK
jgi:hypothetical protein